MNLSDKTILREMEDGNIIITPFNRNHLNPNSVDLTLNKMYKVPDWEKHIEVYGYTGFDCKKENFFKEAEMTEEGMVLMPNQLYLYCCNEKIGCKRNIRATIMGKSSLGRLGLFVHVTAGFVDTGFVGSLVLEMVATVPIRIYPNQKICQIEFVRVEGGFTETYDQKQGSKYMNQQGVQSSKMEHNFKSK